MSKTKKYAYIDALRGYAVLLVIFGHVTQLMQFQGFWALLFSKTGMGVQLFYVVSALTLTMSWISRQDGTINFYIRRMFRIAPLFWLAIIFYISLYGFGARSELPNGISWVDVLLTATFTNSISPSAINSVVPGGWSVAVEMSFYLIFPLCMLIVRGWKSAFVFIFASYYFGKYIVGLLGNFYTKNEYSSDLIYAWKYYTLPSQISAFAIGIFLYFVIKKLSPMIGRVGSYCAFSLCVAVSVSVFHFLQYGGPIAVLWYSTVFAILTFSLSAGYLPMISNKWVQKLGVISFSAYLSHFAVIHQLKSLGVVDYMLGYGKMIALPSLSLLVVLITIIISYLTYKFIEMPGIRLGERFIKGNFEARSIPQPS